MLEKPAIPDEVVISRLQEEYELTVATLDFLPLGADQGTAVYRVVTENGTNYFLKLRRNFDETIVRVPLLLKAQGVQEIIAPIETRSKQGWSDVGEYRMILYPFVEGENGFETELTDHQRRTLGAALKAIHSAQIPTELRRLIPQELFAPQWRERMKFFQAQVENKIFDEPTAAKLAEFIKSRRSEIRRIIVRAEDLASELQSQPMELVLCHTDIHGGNILISDTGELYLVDWDDIKLAPKERDLMFIGGGIDEIWTRKENGAVFYEGYGKTEINFAALAYYRYERVIEDLVVISEQLLTTDEGGADRERSFGWFVSNFEPGQTIEISDNTYNGLPRL